MRSRTQVLVACLAGLLAACGGGSGGSASGGLGGAGLSSGSLKTDTALQAVSSAEAAPSLIAEGVDPNTPKQARLDLSDRKRQIVSIRGRAAPLRSWIIPEAGSLAGAAGIVAPGQGQ